MHLERVWQQLIYTVGYGKHSGAKARAARSETKQQRRAALKERHQRRAIRRADFAELRSSFGIGQRTLKRDLDALRIKVKNGV